MLPLLLTFTSTTLEKRDSHLWTPILAAFTFLSLLSNFLSTQFLYLLVYENQESWTQGLLKGATSWSNHEGSMILWFFLLTYFISFSYPSSNWFPILLITGFSFYLIITSNPFLISPFLSLEGLGLNPSLQDPALTLHPPILYIGLLSLILPYFISFQKKKNSNPHLPLFFLTLGIGLGGWWAYHELGWGGWWGWDPVEIASLWPWLIALALIHLPLKSYQSNYSFFFSIGGFFFTFGTTLLVRSGWLTSIHTFSIDWSRAFYLILLYLGWLGWTLYTLKQIKSWTFQLQNKILTWNGLLIISITLTLIIATLSPFLLGPSFYKTILIPFSLPFLWLIIRSCQIHLFLIFPSFLIFLIWPLSLSGVLTLFTLTLLISNSHPSHKAFALFSTLASETLQEKTTILKGGEEIQFKGLLWKWKGVEKWENEGCILTQTEWIIQDTKKQTLALLFPENRYFPKKENPISKVATASNLFGDIFLAIGGGTWTDGLFCKIGYTPAFPYLWISLLWLCYTFLIPLFNDKRYFKP